MSEFKAEASIESKTESVVSSTLMESLSAMMDGEADSLELRRVVKAVPATPELAKTWQRYHAVRASLQQKAHSNPRVNMLPAIHAQLARESHGLANTTTVSLAQQKLWRFVGQGVIAASVTAAVLLGASFFNQAPAGSDAASVVAGVPAVTPAAVIPATEVFNTLPEFNGEFNPATPTRTVSLEEIERTRLERAVLSFSGVPASQQYKPAPMFPRQLEPFRPAEAQSAQ